MVARPACDRIDYISKHEKKDNEDERAQKTVFLTEYGKSKVRVGFRKIKIFSQPLASQRWPLAVVDLAVLGLARGWENIFIFLKPTRTLLFPYSVRNTDF